MRSMPVHARLAALRGATASARRRQLLLQSAHIRSAGESGPQGGERGCRDRKGRCSGGGAPAGCRSVSHALELHDICRHVGAFDAL